MGICTKIQWCDSTVNPIAGCVGCELFPKPVKIARAIDRELQEAGYRWPSGRAGIVLEALINEAWEKLEEWQKEPDVGFVKGMTTSNIYHARHVAGLEIGRHFPGGNATDLVIETIEKHVKCYAGYLHLNRGLSLFNPQRKRNIGYAPMFEMPTQFPGRLYEASKWGSLKGEVRPSKRWLDGLPRLIFVSDMGDAFSSPKDFEFLKTEVDAITSPTGRRHLWLWLTKRPTMMAKFAKLLGGFPENICAMTTVTSKASLGRIDELRDVDAQMRGLSIEPLWEPIADSIDLSGIDWLIVGGESNKKRDLAEPFALEWALDLRDRCRDEGVAFFVKQLGSRPIYGGKSLKLKDGHGGDWDEWPKELRIRKMPNCFHQYEPQEQR